MAMGLQHIEQRDAGVGRGLQIRRALEAMVKNWILLLSVTGKL